MSGARYFRKGPASTHRRMGVIFPDGRGNWQSDDGSWEVAYATERLAAEIRSEFKAGLLEERGLDRCPWCGRPLPDQAASTDGDGL